jgi:hypothetical protein
MDKVSESEAERPIGVAWMDDDGTLVLQLRMEGPGGIVGDSMYEYAPDHPEYEETLKHIGGLIPGQSKPVKPWTMSPDKDQLSGELRMADQTKEIVQLIFELVLKTNTVAVDGSGQVLSLLPGERRRFDILGTVVELRGPDADPLTSASMTIPSIHASGSYGPWYARINQEGRLIDEPIYMPTMENV